MSVKHAKPNFNQSQVGEILKRRFGLKPSEIRLLPSYDDQNFYVVTTEGGEYILKISNTEDSKNPNLFEVQSHAMFFLHQNGLPTQTSLPSTSGQLLIFEEMGFSNGVNSLLFSYQDYTDCGYGCQKYLMRLLTYLPGTTVSKVPTSPHLLYDIGKTAAKMDKVLQEFNHPHLSVLQRDTFIWNLTNIPMLEAYLHLFNEDPLLEVLNSVIHQFKTSVDPKRSIFRKCINHGDFNDLNVLVQPDGNGSHRISGIIDFGDLSSGYLIYELAITIMYMMIVHSNPLEVGGPILAGWESVLPLNETERDCLYVLVMSRFCQSIVLASHSVKLHPENADYLLSTSRKGVSIFRQLWKLGKEKVEKVWFENAAQFRDRSHSYI